MPVQQIPNPAAAFGPPYSSYDQEIVYAVNNSGATRTVGDVVVYDASGFTSSTVAGNCNVTTTTTAGSLRVIGVVAPPDGSQNLQQDGSTFAAAAVMPIVVRGWARVNIGANTVAADALLQTFTTAGQAQSLTAGATTQGQAIGVAMEAQTAKDANNTIRCWIAKL